MTDLSKCPGFEDVILCPFNPEHRILPHRMQYHLVKCEKNYPHIKLEKCPFNITHRIHAKNMPFLTFELSLKKHKKNCPDRGNFDKYCIEIVGSSYEKKIEVKPPKRPIEDEEENWDHYDEPTYDPRKYVESQPILRKNNGMNRAQREAFRLAEYKRITALWKKEEEKEKLNPL